MTHNNYKAKNEYFNNLSARWDEVTGNDKTRTEKLKEIFELIELPIGSTVLDAGCGTGILFPLIKERIGPDGVIIAIDSAEGMIEESRKRCVNGINYITAPIESVTLPRAHIDVILCFAVFPHIENKTQALARCHFFLKETGKLYIFHLADTESLNAFHRNLDAPVRHDVMPDRSTLEKLFSQTGFTMTRYIDREGLNFVEASVI